MWLINSVLMKIILCLFNNWFQVIEIHRFIFFIMKTPVISRKNNNKHNIKILDSNYSMDISSLICILEQIISTCINKNQLVTKSVNSTENIDKRLQANFIKKTSAIFRQQLFSHGALQFTVCLFEKRSGHHRYQNVSRLFQGYGKERCGK